MKLPDTSASRGCVSVCAQLWGWRSDLEMAAKVGDVEAVRMIAETHKSSEVS